MSNSVGISQPIPSAPMGEKEAMSYGNGAHAPSAPPMESVVVTQPMTSEVSEKLMYAQTEVMQPVQINEEEAKRRIQRNQDFCCFACADSCVDDTWCWYIMCRWYCQCLGICCESCANGCDSCGECCADCLQGCCESDNSGSAGGGGDDCCTGGSDDSCDCDCGGCFD